LIAKVFTPNTLLICFIFAICYSTMLIAFKDFSPAQQQSGEVHLPPVTELDSSDLALGSRLVSFSSTEPPRRLYHTAVEDPVPLTVALEQVDLPTPSTTQSETSGLEQETMLPYLEPESDLLEKLKRAPKV